jgi:hypothetical protein
VLSEDVRKSSRPFDSVMFHNTLQLHTLLAVAPGFLVLCETSGISQVRCKCQWKLRYVPVPQPDAHAHAKQRQRNDIAQPITFLIMEHNSAPLNPGAVRTSLYPHNLFSVFKLPFVHFLVFSIATFQNFIYISSFHYWSYTSPQS